VFIVKVSVVVIVKNAEKTIARCLSSIVEQTHPPHEIIVVDGQSTDKTREIASQFPVRIAMAPAKHTYGSSRNLGVKTATGDVIAFLDADDFADEKWLENAKRALSPANVGIINSKRVYFYPNNWFTDLKWAKMRKKGELGREKPEWKEFSTSGSAFKKELIEKAGYFDEDMFFGTEDKDLAKRIFDMGYSIVFEPNAIIHFII